MSAMAAATLLARRRVTVQMAFGHPDAANI